MSAKILVAIATATAALLAPAAKAQLVDFDKVPTGQDIGSFYNADTVNGVPEGPTFGIIFQPNQWVALEAPYATSSKNVGYSKSGTGSVSILNGFTKQLSFNYLSNSDVKISILSELQGQGDVLAVLNLAANQPADGMKKASIAFNGVAKFVYVYTDENDFAWDDVRFGASSVPEPTSWGLMIGGFALAGGALRRRTKVQVRFAA